MNSSPNLQAHVESAIKKSGDGVVFHTMKFCDYYSFTYADLKDHSKIPFLKIETDTTPQSGGQLRTRIEAYKETLEGLSGSMQQEKNSKKSSLNSNQSSSQKNSRSKNIIVAGIDSGSTSTDVVIMDSGRNILGKAIVATGMSASKSASAALEAALREAGLARSSLRGVAATGYGREIIEMEKQTITEITPGNCRRAYEVYCSSRESRGEEYQEMEHRRWMHFYLMHNWCRSLKCRPGRSGFPWRK